MDIVETKVEQFIRGLVPEREGRLKEMEEQAHREEIPIVVPETAQLLYFLTRSHQVKKVLEIGTAIGYSTIWLACGAAQQDGHITTIDLDPRRLAQAEENFARTGLSDRITMIIGDAREIMTGIDEEFDMIFIDGAKAQYMEFFGECYRLLRAGGILVADNVLFRGMVADEENAEPKYKNKVKLMKEFLWLLSAHPNLETTILPIGDGVSVSLKKR